MAQIAQLSILDGQATPVAHIYKRMPSTSANIVAFRDSTAALATAARSVLTGVYRPSASNNDGAKRVWTVSFPEYDSVNKKVVASGRIKIEVLQNDLLSDSTKKNMAAFLKNFSSDAAILAEISADDPII